MARGGRPAGDGPKCEVRHLTGDDVWRLAEAAVGLHDQILVAANGRKDAPPEDLVTGPRWLSIS